MISVNIKIILTFCFLVVVGRAQEPVLDAQILLPNASLQNQKSYPILIEVSIADGWHINSNMPLEAYLIPTEVEFSGRTGVTYGKIEYSQPLIRKFAFSETEMSVYEGTVYFKTNLTITPDFSGDSLTVESLLRYQACNDQSCLAPSSIIVKAVVKISDTEGPQTYDALFQRFEQQQTTATSDSLDRVISESSLFYVLFFIFIGGLALNLTPCVYPLIPITISYFGGQSQGEKWQLILRAIIYVLGMAITYSVLGVAAALTGGLLGSALQNPLVLIFVALVLVVLALSMFGVYEIRVPQSLALLGSRNRVGYVGTLLMGLTVGLIAAPCIGPFVLGLLTYVGERGDVFIGFWMFFILALGLGTPFIFLGFFSGAINYLPRSGAWMVWVRNLFGFVLIGMAIYFLEPLFPSKILYLYALSLLAIITGIYLGFLDRNKGRKLFWIVRFIIGLSAISLGIFLLISGTDQDSHLSDWQPYNKQNLQNAIQENQPVIIDFYADWCIACRELDIYTFSDSDVIEKTDEFLKLKADLTSYQSADVQQLRKQFSIMGLPTVIFLGKNGTEMTELRLAGFEDAESFLKRVQIALNAME